MGGVVLRIQRMYTRRYGRMRVIADFITKNSIENNGDHCTGKDDHSSEEALDRGVTIDHEDVLRRCLIRHFVSESLANVFPDQVEQLEETGG
jgi:hypothetical protein